MARKIADVMPEAAATSSAAVGTTWSSARSARATRTHRFVWHDRKAWWQQEQAILAYLILNGSLGDAEYLRHAREASSFYNAFFLDHDDGGGLLQRAGERHALPARQRAVQGQPLDERVPLDRAVLPLGGLHEPADHQGADGLLLQAATRRASSATSCASPRISCRPAASRSRSAGSTMSSTPTSTPTP